MQRPIVTKPRKAKKPHGTGRVGFTFIGDRYFCVVRGEVVYMRPVEVAQAKGVQECVHCHTLCNSYCRACRRAVCADQCFDRHELDHSEWRKRELGWTPVERTLTAG